MTAADEAYEAAKAAIAKALKEGGSSLNLDQPPFRALAVLPPEISTLTSLVRPTLSNTQVSDLAPLSGLTGLESLDFSDTQVSDLAPLSGLTGLLTLNLSNTQVSDFAHLSGMTGLGILYLANTRVSDLAPLSGLTGLRVLDLTSTQVSDLAPLSGMTRMTKLHLANTQVNNLAPLSGITRLSMLYLTKTKVLDLRPLLQVLADASDKGFDLRIAGIPATQDPAIAQIAAMEAPTDRAVALYQVLKGGWVPPRSSPANAPFLFLSYATPNRPQITPLHRYLSTQSLPLWWDQDIAAGDEWRATIADRLKSAKAVVTFWTADSVKSNAVIEEAATAQRAKRLVHVRLDDANLPYGFGETQYIDLREWDGTATDPQMAKLVQALRDRLDPPDAAAMAARLTAASPMAMLPIAGRLSPVDTPLNVGPEVMNQPDLDARIEGLKQALIPLQAKAADRINYQFPTDLGHALTAVHVALQAERLSWYGMDDARAGLCDCMEAHDAKGSWNAPTYAALDRFVARLAALQPLLQPRQVPLGQAGAKPPAPDPVVRAADLATVQDIADQVATLVASPEAGATLSPDAVDLLLRDVALITDSATVPPDRRAPRLRRAVRGLAYATGAIIAALTTETVASMLTATEAAAALVVRLQQVFDRLVALFL